MADAQDIVSMLDDIDNKGVGLTAWEINFLDDLLKKSDRADVKFSPKQIQIVERIYKARVKGS